MMLAHPSMLQPATDKVCHADRAEGPEISRHLLLLFCTSLGRTERADNHRPGGVLMRSMAVVPCAICARAGRPRCRPASTIGSAYAGALAQAQPRWTVPRKPGVRQAPPCLQ